MTRHFNWIQTCESTSALLKSDLRQGVPTLMGLASAVQTGGVGRMGNVWESLEGNIHLSIAIPGLMLERHLLPFVPLWLGAQVCQWILKKTNVRVCLKWPNDLILDGKKIGGLLCEGVFHGDHLHGVILGIGINLQRVPTKSVGYPVGHIKALTGVSLYPEVEARDLYYFLCDQIQFLKSVSDILNEWNFFGMDPGHYWLHQTRGWFSGLGLTQDGGYQFEAKISDALSSEKVLVSSAHHEYVWSCLVGQRLLVADIGNSSSKMALVGLDESGSPYIIESISCFEMKAAHRIKQLVGSNEIAPVVHTISVNPEGEKKLGRWLAEMNVTLRAIARKSIRLTKSKYDLSLIGMDRFAALEWLYQQHQLAKGSWPALVVSVGTATTIDLIDGSGLHLGGYIAAGIGTMLESMSKRGALLPKDLELPHQTKESGWPSESKEAMMNAPIQMTAAWIMEERRKLANFCRVSADSIPVVLHGGFSKLVRSAVKGENIEVIEGVPMLGAALMALNGR
jgi:pantothenate kinase type III